MLFRSLGEGGWLGEAWQGLWGTSLAFSFPGLVIGSMVYSLPFVCQPLQDAFESVGPKPREVALNLGASPVDYFFRVQLPLAKRGILTGTVLGFAHTLGEFGVVLMIGGNIPGKTQVISIAIYDMVEQLDYYSAHLMSLFMLVISFCVLWFLYLTQYRVRV